VDASALGAVLFGEPRASEALSLLEGRSCPPQRSWTTSWPASPARRCCGTPRSASQSSRPCAGAS